MATIGFELDKADVSRHGIQCPHHCAAFGGWEQPVGREGDNTETGSGTPECFCQHAAMLGGQIEIIHRPRDVEVAVGIKAFDEAAALVAQIALDLEIGIEPERHLTAILQSTAKLAVQRGL